jgi:hypothetical protein
VVFWQQRRGFVHCDLGSVNLMLWHLLQRTSVKRGQKMSDNLILIIGLFCTALTILGAIMTIQEFKKQEKNG